MWNGDSKTGYVTSGYVFYQMFENGFFVFCCFVFKIKSYAQMGKVSTLKDNASIRCQFLENKISIKYTMINVY